MLKKSRPVFSTEGRALARNCKALQVGAIGVMSFFVVARLRKNLQNVIRPLHAMLPTFRLILFAREVADGKRPVMLRVTYARKSKHFSLNRYALPENWDKEAGRFRRGHPGYKAENDMLRTYEQRAADSLRDMERDMIPFAFDKFEQAVFGDRKPKQSALIWQYLLDIEAGLLEEGKFGNSKFYRATALVIKAYDAKATLKDMDQAWLERLEKWMRKTRSLKDGGILVHMRIIKAACGRAIKQKLMSRDWLPFLDYPLARLKKVTGKRAITRQQMRLFEEAGTLDEREKLCIDLFLFSFYTRGMNLADIAELTRDNIQDLRIEYARKKTGKKYSIKLSAKAAAIIDRYAREDPHLFPIYTDDQHVTDVQKFNRKKKVEQWIGAALRDIAERIGVPAAGLTFYVARHTYATALKKEGVAVAVISEALGHSDIRTTETYLASFDQSVLDEADGLLD